MRWELRRGRRWGAAAHFMACAVGAVTGGVIGVCCMTVGASGAAIMHAVVRLLSPDRRRAIGSWALVLDAVIAI